MRTTNSKFFRFRGEREKVPGCSGYFTSTHKGEDAPCCVFCHELRISFYREEHYFNTSEVAYEFLKNTSGYDKIVCTISTCGSKPTICHPCGGKLEHYIDVIELSLKNFFIERGKKGYFNTEVKVEDILFNEIGFPIVLPNAKKNTPSGNEGVLVNDNFIYVYDMQMVINSGKWMNVINFYQTQEILVPIEKERVGIKIDQGKKWLAIF